jgi:hypothetical protein
MLVAVVVLASMEFLLAVMVAVEVVANQVSVLLLLEQQIQAVAVVAVMQLVVQMVAQEFALFVILAHNVAPVEQLLQQVVTPITHLLLLGHTQHEQYQNSG